MSCKPCHTGRSHKGGLPCGNSCGGLEPESQGHRHALCYTFYLSVKNSVATKIRFLVGKKSQLEFSQSTVSSIANERCLVSSGPVAADGAGIVPDVSVNPGVAGPKTPDCKLFATRLAHERSLVSVLENQAMCFQ